MIICAALYKIIKERNTVMANVILIGATGFVGSAILDPLAELI